MSGVSNVSRNVGSRTVKATRAIYFYREMAEYIQIEIDLLRERHDVTVIECASRWPNPFRVARLVGQADLVVTWFASWHALLPAFCCRLLGRPFLVTAGGYDTARLPGIGYGHQRGGIRRLVSRLVLHLATRVVVISEHTRGEVLALGVQPDRLALVMPGLDPARYARGPIEKRNLVVTVGGVHESNRLRKGLEPFVRTAVLMPELEFVLIGAWTDGTIERLRAIAPANVRFTGHVTHEVKVDWLARSRVVVQASLHEAFGQAVAEGMLCGCVPVVTRAGALPEVVGDTGVVVDHADPEELADGIRKALTLGRDGQARAQARARACFTLERKRRLFDALCRDVLGAKAQREPTQEVSEC